MMRIEGGLDHPVFAGYIFAPVSLYEVSKNVPKVESLSRGQMRFDETSDQEDPHKNYSL